MNSNYLRSLIYGGTDGIITMFNIISGVEGAKMKYSIIFILGFGTLIADAVSMGFSDFLSLKADINYSKSQNKKEIIDYDPKICALITFVSFILFGLIPLLSYLISNKGKANYFKTYIYTIISLFILGTTQSYFTKEKWYISGSYITFYGILASFISFNIGKFMSQFQKP